MSPGCVQRISPSVEDKYKSFDKTSLFTSVYSFYLRHLFQAKTEQTYLFYRLPFVNKPSIASFDWRTWTFLARDGNVTLSFLSAQRYFYRFSFSTERVLLKANDTFSTWLFSSNIYFLV